MSGKTYTKANLKEARKGLKVLANHLSGTAYGAVLKDGKFNISTHTGCYGGYNYPSTYAGSSLLFTYITNQSSKFLTVQDKKEAIILFNYLVKRSPFKGAILTKTGKSALEDGIIIDAFQPVAIVAGAFLNYKRIYNDYQGRSTKRFIKLKKLGVNEHLSYLLAVVLPASISNPTMNMGSGIYNSGALHKDSVKNFAKLCNDPDIKKYDASKSYHELGKYRSQIGGGDTTVMSSFNVSRKTGEDAMTSLYSLAKEKGVLVAASGGLYNNREENKVYFNIDNNLGLLAKWAKEYYKWLH